MKMPLLSKKIPTLLLLLLVSCTSFANELLFKEARTLQREGKFDEAIAAFKSYLLQSRSEEQLTQEQTAIYSEALMQLMNTYQSKGDPEACIQTLQEVYQASPVIQKQLPRDYYSVLSYALSRTENMKEAEEKMLKALTLPLHHSCPERYFRDYAYAAAVFYSNPDFQKEVINWCQEALVQADLCKNTSGKQWVMAMLGSLYKRYGYLNKALELFRKSKEEALSRNDDLGIINSLHTLTDLFLYWEAPEYANLYASEAIRVEKYMTTKNPMLSAQTYINKGRAMHQLGEADSAVHYTELARELCTSLPYNSGMVDINLLHGTILTESGGDSLQTGIEELLLVTQQGTPINRAKAYHQLAQTYLKQEANDIADAMLDSMHSLLHLNDTPAYIPLNYQSILNYYLEDKNYEKVEQYTRMMLREQESLKEKELNFNLIESIVEQQSEKERQELKIVQLREANQRLWILIYTVLSVCVISIIVVFLLKQKKQHKVQMKHANEKMSMLVEKLNQSKAENKIINQEISNIMSDKDNRQEMETLTPFVLQKNGESQFRQRFELLYPLFLPRLRERIPSITRREELLSMLIFLKRDNKEIAELLAIAPRSVLMLRHRFRQKIGITTDNSLEEFIESTLGLPNMSEGRHKAHTDFQEQPLGE